MTQVKMSPLRRRMVEDMQIRGLEATTQASYIRAIEVFAGFLGRSPDSATPEELRAWQLRGEIVGAESRLETKIAESDARNAERYALIAEGQTTQLRWMIGCMRIPEYSATCSSDIRPPVARCFEALGLSVS